MDLSCESLVSYSEEEDCFMTSCVLFNFYFNAIWVDEDVDSEEGNCIWVLYSDDGAPIDFGRHKMF